MIADAKSRKEELMRTLLVALVVTLLAAAAALGQKKDAAADVERNFGRKDSAKSAVFFCDVLTTECRTDAASFRLKQSRDLFVYVTWPGVTGDHVQTVEFYLPDGSLYGRQDTPFRVGLKGSRAVQAPGANVSGRYLTSSRNVATVITPLAIEGTYITQRSLTGKWSVRVLLDGKAANAAQFTLQPSAEAKPAEKAAAPETPKKELPRAKESPKTRD